MTKYMTYRVGRKNWTITYVYDDAGRRSIAYTKMFTLYQE